MGLMRNIKKMCTNLCSLKPLKLHLGPRCYKRLSTSNSYLRGNYSDDVEMWEKSYFYEKHKAYANIFKEEKICKESHAEHFHILNEVFEIDDQNLINKTICHKHVLKCSITHIRDVAVYLREMNITSQHLIRAPWLLSLTKENIEAKKDIVEQPYLFRKVRDGLGFTVFDPELINSYNKKFEEEDKEFGPHRNRIYYIGFRLNIPVDLLTLKLTHVWPILHVKKMNIDLIIDLLLDYNYAPMDILRDVWVLRCNHDIVRDRLNMMREMENKPYPQFWVFRCSDSQFQRFVNREKKYGYNSNKDCVTVLTEELELNTEEALDFISKGYLKNVKQTNTLEFKIKNYKEAGLSNQEIMTHPLLLRRTDERIPKRIKYLRRLNLMDISVYYLCSSDALFEKHVQKLLTKRKILNKV